MRSSHNIFWSGVSSECLLTTWLTPEWNWEEGGWLAGVLPSCRELLGSAVVLLLPAMLAMCVEVKFFAGKDRSKMVVIGNEGCGEETGEAAYRGDGRICFRERTN